MIEGYATIFAEVDEQLATAPGPRSWSCRWVWARSPPRSVAHYSASAHDRRGGAASTPRAARLRARPARPVDVPGPHDSIMAGLNCGTVSLDRVAGGVRRGVDLFVAVDDAAAEQAMRDLATIGVVAGETGARVAGRVARARGRRRVVRRRSPAADVLVLCTEGATDPVAYERIVGTLRAG